MFWALGVDRQTVTTRINELFDNQTMRDAVIDFIANRIVNGQITQNLLKAIEKIGDFRKLIQLDNDSRIENLKKLSTQDLIDFVNEYIGTNTRQYAEQGYGVMIRDGELFQDNQNWADAALLPIIAMALNITIEIYNQQGALLQTYGKSKNIKRVIYRDDHYDMLMINNTSTLPQPK